VFETSSFSDLSTLFGVSAFIGFFIFSEIFLEFCKGFLGEIFGLILLFSLSV
jgi:hypothetical protein